MPVILTLNEAMKFMEEKEKIYLTKNFISTTEEDLSYYPVSKYVNSPLNDSKTSNAIFLSRTFSILPTIDN